MQNTGNTMDINIIVLTLTPKFNITYKLKFTNLLQWPFEFYFADHNVILVGASFDMDWIFSFGCKFCQFTGIFRYIYIDIDIIDIIDIDIYIYMSIYIAIF